jgi:hypothetical protein
VHVLFRSLPVSLLFALAACATTPSGEIEGFVASLSGAQEVPAVAGAGGGSAEVVFDHATSTVRWTVQFHGLSGPVTGAHLHGPAAPGQNAPVVVPFPGPWATTPLRGQARITAEQFGQLASGQWYVNLHTARHPQGELRGQLRPLASR